MSSQKHKPKDGNVTSFIIETRSEWSIVNQIEDESKIWLKYVKTIM